MEYFKEDNEIIKKVNEIKGESDKEKITLQKLQIEAMLRNRASLEESGKISKNISLILIVFAIIQFTVALFQFLFSIYTSDNKLFGLFLVIVIFLLSIYMMKKFDKLFKH